MSFECIINNIWFTVSLALPFKFEDVCLLFVHRFSTGKNDLYLCVVLQWRYSFVYLALIDVFGGDHHAL